MGLVALSFDDTIEQQYTDNVFQCPLLVQIGYMGWQLSRVVPTPSLIDTNPKPSRLRTQPSVSAIELDQAWTARTRYMLRYHDRLFIQIDVFSEWSHTVVQVGHPSIGKWIKGDG
jgi:hypothetical protein